MASSSRSSTGRVNADDYDWYLVQAIGWPHRGWVAAADHDGVAWIEDRSASSAKPATFTAVEASLVSALRTDAAIGCAPRRVDLPPRAIAGVECRVNGAVVTRVGAYHFGDARDAATTYLERLASYDVKPAAGDCPGGKSGDAAWMAGDRKAGKDSDRVYVGDTGPWVVGRIGCFLDENGTANVRLTCGTTYVGILGRDADLADLDRFALASRDRPDEGRPDARDLPLRRLIDRRRRGCKAAATLSVVSAHPHTLGGHRYSTAAQAEVPTPWTDEHSQSRSRRHRRSRRRALKAVRWPTRPRTSTTRAWPSTWRRCSTGGGCSSSWGSPGSVPGWSCSPAAPRRRARRRPASASATAAASAVASTAAADCAVIPEETAGPFPGDGSNGPDVLSQSGVVRADIRSSFGAYSGTAAGVPLTIKLAIQDLANGCAPLAKAAVYVWHCDRDGNYSLYSQAAASQNYLRGVQEAGTDGIATFQSIFPACYSGRWPHIHFEVYPNLAAATDDANKIATSQIALPKDTCDAVYATDGYGQSVRNLQQVSLTSDMVFGDDGGVHEIGTVSGSVSSGYTVTLAVPVKTA